MKRTPSLQSGVVTAPGEFAHSRLFACFSRFNHYLFLVFQQPSSTTFTGYTLIDIFCLPHSGTNKVPSAIAKQRLYQTVLRTDTLFKRAVQTERIKIALQRLRGDIRYFERVAFSLNLMI